MLFRSGSGSFSGHVAIRGEIVLRVVNGYYFLGSTVNCTTLGNGINHGHLVLVRHVVGGIGVVTRTDGILGVDQPNDYILVPHGSATFICGCVFVKHVVDVFPVNHPRYGFTRSMVGCWVIHIANCNLPSVALVKGNRLRRSKGVSCGVLVVRFHRQGVLVRYVDVDRTVIRGVAAGCGGLVGEGRARVLSLDLILGIERLFGTLCKVEVGCLIFELWIRIQG